MVVWFEGGHVVDQPIFEEKEQGCCVSCVVYIDIRGCPLILLKDKYRMWFT